jgi:hypothetical protein
LGKNRGDILKRKFQGRIKQIATQVLYFAGDNTERRRGLGKQALSTQGEHPPRRQVVSNLGKRLSGAAGGSPELGSTTIGR